MKMLKKETYQSDCLPCLHSEGHVLKNLCTAHKHTHEDTQPKHILRIDLLALMLAQVFPHITRHVGHPQLTELFQINKNPPGPVKAAIGSG